MTSMKLYKPNYAFGANQRSFSSKYEHQEHKSESNYADYAFDSKSSAYDSHAAQEYVLGQSMGGFDTNEAHLAMGNNKSTNYYANAQSSLPNPPINVQQGHHVMGKMKKHDGYNGRGLGNNNNSPKYAVPALVDHSSFGIDDDESHMMGGTAEPYHVGQVGYKDRGQKAYNYNEGGVQGGYASKGGPILSSPKYLSPIKTNQGGQNGQVKGNMDRGWANPASDFSSPTHAPRSGFLMQKGEHMIGDMDHGWDDSTDSYSSPTHGQHPGLGLHEEEHMMGSKGNGWANSPTRYSSPTQSHLPAHTMYKKDHMMEKDGRNWANSPGKFASPTQPHYSSRALPKEEPLMGTMNNGWAKSPTKYSRANSFNGSSHNMQGGEQGQLGWSDKSINGFRPNQANHSAHGSYDRHDQHVDDDVHDIMDEILTKYPSHNVSGGHGSNWAAKPNAYASQSQAAGYARQQSFGGSTNYGGAAQSMSSSSSKFASNKQMNAGYSSNYGKQEYAAGSRAKKYEANGMINGGGYY